MAAESSGEEILEGFLCPICMKDLKTPSQLSSHFEEFHAEDKDILRQLRSVFDRAKKIVLKKDDTVSSKPVDENGYSDLVSNGTPGSGGIDLMLWDPQDFGSSRSHLNDFKKARKEKIERCIVETNNVLIRLDKLVKSGIYNSDSALSSAIKTRKDVEKRAVPWENDKDVKYCRCCSEKFTVIQRRHHCRLCGKVFCNDCCDFISFDNANDILHQEDGKSSTFLDDSAGGMGDKNGIRTCHPCLELLQRHCEIKYSKKANPNIVALYEKMKIYMRECESILPKFLKMANCVNIGEMEYSLDAAMESRIKLLKNFENIDAISKKIQFLDSGGEKPPHPQALKLQKLIRSFAANFLQENMFTMPTLPTREQYSELIRLRQEKLARQRQEEKEKVIKASLLGSSTFLKGKDIVTKTSADVIPQSDEDSTASEEDRSSGFFRAGSLRSKFKKKSFKPFTAVSITKKDKIGWGPVQVTMTSSPDPMQQQIDIIKGYIRQAKQEKKFEEVALFEQNLKELELEYMKQRQSR